MAEWKTMRKSWTDARDKAKVPKGAVSGVSLGDAIEAVGKAVAVGLPQTLAALDKLAPAAKKYREAMAEKGKKKKPSDKEQWADAEKWIKDTLEKKAEELKTHIQQTKTLLATVRQKAAGADAELNNCVPAFSQFKDAYERHVKNGTNFRDEASGPLAKAAAAAAVYARWKQFMQTVASTNLALVEGKASPAKAAADFAGELDGWAAALADTAKAADIKQLNAAISTKAPNPLDITTALEGLEAAIKAQGV